MTSASSFADEGPLSATFINSRELTAKWTSVYGFRSSKPMWVTDTELYFDYEASVPVVQDVYGKRLWIFNLIYVIFVFGGQKFMAKRPPYRLAGLLKVWNLLLAVFSIAGTIRTFPSFVASLREHGVYPSVCIGSDIFNNKVTAFWAMLFTTSKAAELVDTFFLVVRKRPVIFLHWYHHMLVTYFSYYVFTNAVPVGGWFMVMNYLVHALMYSYFFIRAINIPVPQLVSMSITSLQIAQMVVCSVVVPLAWYYKQQGMDCALSGAEATMFMGVYLSFFVLFGKFFFDAYLRPKKKSRVD